MMKRLYTLLCLATLLLLRLQPLQAMPTDSLIALLPTLPHDSLRLEVLHEITLNLQHPPAQET